MGVEVKEGEEIREEHYKRMNRGGEGEEGTAR